MSTPFKPLSDQITNKMIADLKAGTSIFQRPNNSLNSALPFNLESGHRYAGPSALILLMQKRDDPRWGTSNQANRNHTAVVKGATGTLIQFMSNYEYQKMVDGAGEPVLKENGKQRTERIKLEEPIQVDAWLFNGEQMRNIQKWEKEPNILAPAERARLILDNSKAVIENGGDDRFYDREIDTIIIPAKETFAIPEQYYAEALHQLAHRTYQLEVADRAAPPQAAETVSEELRTNMSSLFMSKELNLPYDLEEHIGYVNSWSELLKNDPAELFKAASDAQKIMDHILGFEQQLEEKQEIAAENGLDQDVIQEAPGVATSPAFDSTKLNKGEIIPHNGTEFKVVAELKNKVYQMQDLGSERKFKMSSKDVLFTELLEARSNTQERAAGMQQDEVIDQSRDQERESGEFEQEDNSFSMSR